nr:glycoside hydrolase family 20 zincin-like fold domain-containing protein [Kordiimonas gwangyangensis]
MKTKLLGMVAAVVGAGLLLTSCGEKQEAALEAPAPAIIPAPAKLSTTAGAFVLPTSATIAVPAGDERIALTAQYLAEKLALTTNVKASVSTDGAAAVRFVAAGDELPSEGYTHSR